VIRIAALLICCAVPVGAAQIDGDRVQALVEQALRAAGQGGHAVISSHRGFPPCPSAPTVGPHAGGWQAVRITCDAAGWHRVIRIRDGQAAPRIGGGDVDSAKTPALVLTESLPRGTVLNPAHLEQVDIAAAGQGDLIALPESAIGRSLRVNLGAGQALLGRHLEHDWQVEKGAPVTIASRAGPILIQTSGVALEPGQLGQAIRVSNARSGQLVHVIVTGPNKVTVRPNMR